MLTVFCKCYFFTGFMSAPSWLFLIPTCISKPFYHPLKYERQLNPSKKNNILPKWTLPTPTMKMFYNVYNTLLLKLTSSTKMNHTWNYYLKMDCVYSYYENMGVIYICSCVITCRTNYLCDFFIKARTRRRPINLALALPLYCCINCRQRNIWA